MKTCTHAKRQHTQTHTHTDAHICKADTVARGLEGSWGTKGLLVDNVKLCSSSPVATPPPPFVWHVATDCCCFTSAQRLKSPKKQKSFSVSLRIIGRRSCNFCGDKKTFTPAKKPAAHTKRGTDTHTHTGLLVKLMSS